MTCPRAGVKTPGPPARDTARGPHGGGSPITRSTVPTPLGRFRFTCAAPSWSTIATCEGDLPAIRTPAKNQHLAVDHLRLGAARRLAPRGPKLTDTEFHHQSVEPKLADIWLPISRTKPRARPAAETGGFRALRADLEHISPVQPGGQSSDEVSYRSRAVGMDPHVSARSVEPPDLGPFHVCAGCPPLIRAPGLPVFDQCRIFAKVPGERIVESSIGESGGRPTGAGARTPAPTCAPRWRQPEQAT
jgi:hypothetical protein